MFRWSRGASKIITSITSIATNRWQNYARRRLSSNSSKPDQNQRQWSKISYKAGLFAATTSGMLAYYLMGNPASAEKRKCKKPSGFKSGDGDASSSSSSSSKRARGQKLGIPAEDERKDLPTFNKEDVANHGDEENMWVSYKSGVYDVTKFVKLHPGGSIILMAAGGNLEQFFNYYPFHESEPYITKILEEYRIGNLAAKDRIDMADLDDPFADEPERHPNTFATTPKPYVGGAHYHLLMDNFYTPNEYFYVRNHMPVPKIDPKDYYFELEIEGTDKRMKYSLEDLKKMPSSTITNTLMCTGNRRAEPFKMYGQEKAFKWTHNAMSNATWKGARLCDLLKSVGIERGEKKYKHVQFDGWDMEANGVRYGSSVPLSKCVDEYGDVIIAYEMNGQPLPRDHGYPARMIIPGYTGARNCKWLAKIRVSENEHPGHYQQIDYKAFGPSVTARTAVHKDAPAVQLLPVTSAICVPNSGDTVEVKDGTFTIKGYAYSGAGSKIMRLDYTIDGGQTWYQGTIDHQLKDVEAPHHWSWTLWSAKVPVTKDMKEVEIWTKAVDSSFNVQPENWKSIYSFQGCLNNAYHRVKVNLKH